MYPQPASDTLSAIFGALADPTRRAILDRLSTGTRSVTELAEPFQMSQPSISKHLKVLEKAGLVVRGRDAQWRPRALEAAPLAQAEAYLEKFRKLWEERLDRLELYLKELQSKPSICRVRRMQTNFVRVGRAQFAAIATLALIAPAPVSSQKNPDLAPYMIGDRASEVALARSAAPKHVSDSATVLVLTRTGYVEAARGTNGFTCLVIRSFGGALDDPKFWNPRVRAPHCLNPPAVRTVLPEMLKRAEWIMAGVSPDRNRNADTACLCLARVLHAGGGLHGIHALSRAISRRRQLEASHDVLLRPVDAGGNLRCG